MRLNLNHIWIIVFVALFFVNCGDDKDKNSAGNNQGTYLGNNLELFINDVQLKGRVLGITDTGTLILQYIIPGETVIDVPLTEVDGWLEGTANITGGTVDARGIVKQGKLLMKLTVKTINDLTGTWQLPPFKTNAAGAITSSAIFVDAQPADVVVSLSGKNLTLAELCELVEALLGKYSQIVNNITFNDDGFVTASFADEALDVTPNGLMQYYVANNQLHLLPNLSEIFALATSYTQSRAETDAISEILNLLTEGIPFIYELKGSSLKIYITKDMILPYLEILKELLPYLPDDNSLVKLLKAYFPQVYGVIDACTELQIGIVLEKK